MSTFGIYEQCLLSILRYRYHKSSRAAVIKRKCKTVLPKEVGLLIARGAKKPADLMALQCLEETIREFAVI